MFNLGYMYTNSKSIYTFFTAAAGTPETRTWNSFGQNLGSLLVRFIYSKYIAKDYYKF